MIGKFALTLLIPALSAVYSGGLQAWEAQLYGMTQWTSTCPGGARSAWDNMGDAWYDEITNKGFNFFGIYLFGHGSDAFSRDRRMVDGYMDADIFTEQLLFAGGQDRSYADEGDAVMIFTHGGDWNNHWHGLMRAKDSNGDCYLDADSELRMGDFDAEFLHLSSCHSLDDNHIPYLRDIFGYPENQRRLHLVTGFHGCMWIGNSLISDYRDFADDAFDMSIGLAWMLNMYRTGITADNYVQCPVAYAVGANASDCINRLTTERYDNIKSDPSSASTYCYYYYANCDPACEDAFGNAWK